MGKRMFELFLLFIVIIFAFFLRTYNVNWDSGTHIHPDERFLTMVTNDMRLPNSFGDYLNPQVSTMNPHNINYGFFVYGTFPIYLVKILAIVLKMDDYGNITLVGRYLSALFDTGIVLLLYLLSKVLLNCSIVPLLTKNNNRTIEQSNNYISAFVPLFPSFLYSIMVLPIQLSHFFAVDTFLAFFMILSFYLSLLIYRSATLEQWGKVFLLSVLLGTTIGLGLASKVTMVFIVPLDLAIIFISFKKYLQKLAVFFIRIFVYSYIPLFFFTYLFFRFAMPMAFSTADLLNPVLNPKWIKNLTDLQNMGSSSLSNTFPPAIQWFHTPPIIYPLKNMVLWGMGVPMAIICAFALILNFKFLIPQKFLQNLAGQVLNENFKQKISKLCSPINLLSLFSVAFFIYQGMQFSKNMRYFYPIYWCLAFFGGLFIIQIARHFKNFFLSVIIFVAVLIYPVSFLQIYARPHTRVAASRYMFANFPLNSAVTFEEWDDPLPLAVDGKIITFRGLSLPMFWPDSQEKWDNILAKIIQTDYIILSSNRVYGSITRRPDIYPKTELYYKLLFSEKFGFTKIKDFSSRPTIPLLNFEFVDDAADESFTVYDHPKVTIFKKNKILSLDEYKKLLKL